MSAVLSSVSEIARVGGWALRGIGYPFGIAERGVRLLTWSEAVGGQAIRGLRLAEDAIGESLMAGQCRHEGDASAGRTVQALGRHLLEIGAPVIDLATCDARRATIGHVAADGVFGLGLLPSLAHLLAQRRLSGLLSYRAEADDFLPDGFPAAGWMIVRGGPGRAECEFIHGSFEGETGDLLRSALSGVAGVVPAGMRERVLRDIEEIAGGRRGRMGALAVADPGPSIDGLLAALRPGQGVRSIDFTGHFADALANGVPIDAGDLHYLYGLEVRTWAPTSERSRSQAGYGVF
ncbi:hypothetical protein ACUSIJ_15740 [Pseudochelatococcus sp. B33]